LSVTILYYDHNPIPNPNTLSPRETFLDSPFAAFISSAD
jgi:hypothetical protein